MLEERAFKPEPEALHGVDTLREISCQEVSACMILELSKSQLDLADCIALSVLWQIQKSQAGRGVQL